jgi:hypothetical protein
MREVFFIIGKQDVVLWSDASASPVLLPDSRARWEAIWKRRRRLVEIAHSHPAGPLGFSVTDETTMSALTSGLGKKVVFSVVAPNGMVSRDEEGKDHVVEREPGWTTVHRLASGMKAQKEK